MRRRWMRLGWVGEIGYPFSFFVLPTNRPRIFYSFADALILV